MIQNCKKCKGLFNSLTDARLCPACLKEDDEIFAIVKEFIYANPGATISEVSTELDVSVNRIKRYLREGRLEILEKHNLFLECEKCGVAIQTGRFCPACANEFFNDLKKSGEEGSKSVTEKKSDGLKYFFIEGTQKKA